MIHNFLPLATIGRLLGDQAVDVDGNTENRSDTVSVFNGPPPVIRVFKSEAAEIEEVGAWLAAQSSAGILPHEFGVFVRSDAQLHRAQAAVAASELPFKVLDEHAETTNGDVSISTNATPAATAGRARGKAMVAMRRVSGAPNRRAASIRCAARSPRAVRANR